MIRVLDGVDYPDAEAFVADLNKARLANPQQWLTYVGQVGGCRIELKTFDKGDLQILRADGRDIRRNEYGMNVGQWKAEIAARIGEAIARRADS